MHQEFTLNVNVSDEIYLLLRAQIVFLTYLKLLKPGAFRGFAPGPPLIGESLFALVVGASHALPSHQDSLSHF